MKIRADKRPGRRTNRRGSRAFTLVELLVVVSIIGVLCSLLFPAVQAARESSRNLACKNNLRQFGIGLNQHAEKFGAYCSGAFDWQQDGAVTEVGWVADLVNAGIPTGKMLCPSNPAQISATYNDLLSLDTSAFDSCVDRLGSAATTALDGSSIVNPCRQIATTPLAAGGSARLALVNQQIYNKHYNTNYTASWWLVRSGVILNADGTLASMKSGCQASLTSRNSTLGPLARGKADSCAVSTCFLPLMACGASSATLTQQIGSVPAGSPATLAFTAGPVVNPTMQLLVPTSATKTGTGGWWQQWNATLQDYRGFAPVHRGMCNVLMADGSVQSFADINNDHYLNNGFSATSQNGFSDSTAELPPDEFYSGWSLRP